MDDLGWLLNPPVKTEDLILVYLAIGLELERRAEQMKP